MELVVLRVNNHVLNVGPGRLILVSIALLDVLILLLVVIIAPTLFGFIDPITAEHNLGGLHAMWCRLLSKHNDLGTFRIHVRLLINVLLVRG